MTTNVRELLGDLRRQMTPANGDYLDRLMKRPEVQKVLDADERELVAARVALVTKLKAAPSQHAKACEAAGKAHAAASTLVEKKRKELAAAMDAERDACSKDIAASYGLEREVGLLERQLFDGADVRIGLTEMQLLDLASNGLRRAFRITHTEKRGGQALVYSNAMECTLAGEALKEAVSACRQLKLEALTGTEVEQALSTMFAKLTPPLAAAGLRPPRIAEGKVLPPLDVRIPVPAHDEGVQQ